MKHILTLLLLVTSIACFAQTDKTDLQERKADNRQRYEERTSKAKEKVEYNLFRRQMLVLPEYVEERKKIPALQKATKTPVRVVVYIDSLNDAEDNKTLTGYIREDAGDNTANVYEVTYDRAQKKITAVKPTGESIDIEKDDATDKPVKEKTIRKKSKDDDDDDDADEKPAKTKHKEKDDE